MQSPLLSAPPMAVLFACAIFAASSAAANAQTAAVPGQPKPCAKPVSETILQGQALDDYRQLKGGFKMKFPGLTPGPAEERLLKAAVTGTTAWAGSCADDRDSGNDPAHAAQWGPERTVSADLIRWMLVDPQAQKRIDPNGIDLHGARIAGPLNLSNIAVRFPLTFAHCSLGHVRLGHAETRTMDFDGSLVKSFDGQRLSVAGDLLINDGFTATGLVDLTAARIDGDLRCNGGRFEKQPESLVVALAQINRGAYFQKLTTLGRIRLNRATINGDLEFDGAQFGGADSPEAASGAELQAAFVTVKGALYWRDVKLSPTTPIDLSSTSIGTLWDSGSDWPASPKLFLDGFVYQHISVSAPQRARERLQWLGRQPGDFRPQPYLQLAKVLRQGGRDGDATEILIANERQAYEAAAQRWSKNVCRLAGTCVRGWSFLLRWTIGYGHRPFLALRPIIFFVVLGSALFWLGYRKGILTPTAKDAYEYYLARRTENTKPAPGDLPPAGYQPFNPIFYSLETFLPLVKLHQEENWLPNAELAPKWRGALLRYYLWIHILAGWFFTAMLVAGVTGLVHYD